MQSSAAIALLLLLALATIRAMQKYWSKHSQPPCLDETIPFISNAWQFMTDKELFISRLREAFKKSPIVQCYLGPIKIYYIAGKTNISSLFRSSFASEPWIELILEHTAGYAHADVTKFSRDLSGPASVPRKDQPGIPSPNGRIWHAMHRVYEETLSNARSVSAFAVSFQKFLAQELSKSKDVEEVALLVFLKNAMGTAATRSVFGSRILEINPGLLDAYWAWDATAETLAFGLPSWLTRRGTRARSHFRAMCSKWYQLANEEFSQISVDQDVDWEPIFGSRMSRALGGWARTFNFSPDSMGATFALAILGLNSNTIPICTWMMMELARDSDLLRDVKEEVSKAMIDDGTTLAHLDVQKVVTLPLLQSVFTECLRLHIRLLITRTSTEPVTISGYHLPRGSYFQAPTQAAHLNETIWGRPGHPASSFWGYRHVKEIEVLNDAGLVEKKLEFSLSGKSGSLFPYGGGVSMCAGRGFAKHEILLAVGMLVTSFDLEFVEWIKHDGSPSYRPAKDDFQYANAVASPPDRDLKVRIRRRVT